MQYTVEGGMLPVVICTLGEGETVMCENGGMAWMSPNMQMQTKGGGLGKMLGRSFTGESAFLNYYSPAGGSGVIAFASSFPGCILPLDITPGNCIIAQKTAFLAAEASVELGVHMQKKLGAGLVGGEGFILQKLSGNGKAFLEIDGYAKQYDLAAGQSIVLDTGYLAAMTESCSMDITAVKGLKNKLLGGEGLFNTIVTGPGRVWIQSMPQRPEPSAAAAGIKIGLGG